MYLFSTASAKSWKADLLNNQAVRWTCTSTVLQYRLSQLLEANLWNDKAVSWTCTSSVLQCRFMYLFRTEVPLLASSGRPISRITKCDVHMYIFRAAGPFYVPLPCYRAALCASSVLQGRFMYLFRATGPLYVPLPCCRAALCASSVLQGRFM